MAEIKPSEVSTILRQQLENFKQKSEMEEVGTVLLVGDGIARVYGLQNARSGELVTFSTKNGDEITGIALNLEEDNVGVVLLGDSKSLNEGDICKRTGRIASIKVGEGLLGRVINTLGQPIDGKGDIEGELFEMPIERKAPGVIYRQPVKEPLQTGLKAVDAMIPIGRGQSSATARPARRPSPSTPSSIRNPTTSRANRFTASMWLWDRKVRPLLHW